MGCLIEVGTHLVLDAELAGCRAGEVTLMGRLPHSCRPGQLAPVDREFLGVPLPQAFAATGVGLLSRAPANRILPVDWRVQDGPWQRGAVTVLSSRTSDGVLQQIWAHLLVHHVLRDLMTKTDATCGLDPGRILFTETPRSARRSVIFT